MNKIGAKSPCRAGGAMLCARKNGEKRQIRYVLRYLVFISLLGAATLCAAVSYIVLHNSEMSRYEEHYGEMTKQMISSVEGLMGKHLAMTKQLALVATIRYPNATSWPFVGISDFHKLDQSIVNVTGAASVNSIVPIVSMELLDEFNAYAKDFLAGEEFIQSYPQIYNTHDVGVYELIDGIAIPLPNNRSSASSPGRQLITPILNPPMALTQSGFTLANLNQLPEAAIAIDDILSCTESGFGEQCSSMSGFLIGSEYAAASDTNIFTPILSAGSSDHVLGFAISGFNWKNELKRLIVSNEIDGIHCILSSIAQPSGQVTAEHTFLLEDGDAKYEGAGDQHHHEFSSMGKSTPLYLSGSHAQLSVHFRLDIYPTYAYEHSFYTDTPLYTAIGLASMIVFTSLIFIVYDYLVNEDAKEKTAVLRMKRDFVRFISHEIRTPLNTVTVGMQLLYEGLVSQHGGVPMAVEEMMDLATDVQSSTTLAVSVLNDLLHFDKLEAGELQIAHDPVCIWDTVKIVVKSFRIPANQKQVAIDLVFDNCVDESVMKRQLVMIGDKFKISHVIRNMMSNAMKFTTEGGSITVHVKWTKAPPVESTQPASSFRMATPIAPVNLHTCRDIITITVTDTGYGLTEDQLGMLFRDGVQFNPNELQAGQGSGLGLYLSQAIVTMHGGKMWATSKGKDQGASFSVQLPVHVDMQSIYLSVKSSEERAVNLPPSGSHKTKVIAQGCSGDILDFSVFSTRETVAMRTVPTADNSNSLIDKVVPGDLHVDNLDSSATIEEVAPLRMAASRNDRACEGRILVVDDASSNRKIVCKMLSKRGFECTEAKDGREGVDTVIGKGDMSFFDCILMDFEMPILNGPDATKELRQLGYKIPIFGLTGNVMVEDIEYFISRGANHVMSKPFQISEFISQLCLTKSGAGPSSKYSGIIL